MFSSLASFVSGNCSPESSLHLARKNQAVDKYETFEQNLHCSQDYDLSARLHRQEGITSATESIRPICRVLNRYI